MNLGSAACRGRWGCPCALNRWVHASSLLYDCTSCAADQRIRYVCWATGSKSVLRGNTRYAGFRSVWQCGKRNYCVWQNSEKEVRAVSKDHKAKVIH